MLKYIFGLAFMWVLCSLIINYILNRKLSKKTQTANIAKSYSPVKTNKTFKDIVGNDDIKEELSLLVEFLNNPKRFVTRGARMPHGILLYGTPGNGKTLTAKALAGEADVPFYSVNGSDFVEMFVGVGASRIRSLFNEAKKNSPCVIFIDEIDAIGSKRNAHTNNEGVQTLNALLSELDGFSENSNVLVIAATNRKETLDPALIRSGRFDKHLLIMGPMNPHERFLLLSLYAKNKFIAPEVNLKGLAKDTTGFSCADLESLLNDAVIISIKKNKSIIDNECIEDALLLKNFDGYKKKDSSSNIENELIAYHECGHAVIAMALGCYVNKITIIGTTSGVGGYVDFRSSKENTHIKLKSQLEKDIMVSYGGLLGEQIYLKSKGYNNDMSVGAISDLEKATNILTEMICTYGMGNFSIKVSDRNNKYIINEINNTANILKKRANGILLQNEAMFHKLVLSVLNKETLNYSDLRNLFPTYDCNSTLYRISGSTRCAYSFPIL